MVIKSAILFRIKNLQKGTGRVSAVIFGKFVNLIQYNDRIGDTASLDSFHDPSGHSTDISTSVATDFRLITDTTKTDPYIFSSESPCNTLSDTGLPGSRSTDK